MSLKVYETTQFGGGGGSSNSGETSSKHQQFPTTRHHYTTSSLPIIKTVRLKPESIEHNTNNNINNTESDLTELSWLTSNVSAMFNSGGGGQQQQQQRYPQPFNLPLVQQQQQHQHQHQQQEQQASKNWPRVADDDQIAPSSSTSPAPSSSTNASNNNNINTTNSLPVSPLSSSSASSISSSSSSSLSYSSDHSTGGGQIVSSKHNKQKLKTPRLKAQQQRRQQQGLNQNQISESRHHYHHYRYNQPLSVSTIDKSVSQQQTTATTTTATNDDDTTKQQPSAAKPALTLSCLIFMALHESPNECLPVREIYEWIEANFPFYRSCSNTGWKSSIRHNLSFSKCFRKMDRAELVFYRNSTNTNTTTTTVKLPMKSSDYLNISGRKKRAPNSVGTCWKVNSECKSFLIHTLKRSAFWTKNSSLYPKICALIREHDSSSSSSSSSAANNFNRKSSSELISSRHHSYLINPRIRVQTLRQQLVKEEEYEIEEDEDEEENTTNTNNNEDEMNENLHEFVQNEHGLRDLKPLHSPSEPSSATVSPHSNQSNRQLDLSFSSSTSSTLFATNHSSFQSNRPPLTPESINADDNNDDLQQCTTAKRRKTSSSSAAEIKSIEQPDLSNSDLEIEVASTLVGMKWLFKNKK